MPILLAAVLMLLTASALAEAALTLPAFHPIAYDPALETLDDENGADTFNHVLDHPDSRYYVINDYYNLVSGNGLHILPRFETCQQTTEYTCGCASALMVLNRYGHHECNEMDIARLAGTDTVRGTTVEGLADFFTSIRWQVTFHADTAARFANIADCEAFFVETLDSGTPILLDWVDWGGHWQVLIGLDTCQTDSPCDDVLILADPYDITDHLQNGYTTVPFGRFFSMWLEGPCAGKAEPYQQPYVIAVPQP